MRQTSVIEHGIHATMNHLINLKINLQVRSIPTAANLNCRVYTLQTWYRVFYLCNDNRTADGKLNMLCEESRMPYCLKTQKPR
jgi:hypothetical protein